jgi:hypothetical protein
LCTVQNSHLSHSSCGVSHYGYKWGIFVSHTYYTYKLIQLCKWSSTFIKIFGLRNWAVLMVGKCNHFHFVLKRRRHTRTHSYTTTFEDEGKISVSKLNKWNLIHNPYSIVDGYFYIILHTIMYSKWQVTFLEAISGWAWSNSYQWQTGLQQSPYQYKNVMPTNVFHDFWWQG